MIMTPEEIGQLIRTTRKAQGLRQPELAARAHALVGQGFRRDPVGRRAW